MLFRLKRNPECKRSQFFDYLYEWVEVLAIIPNKLRRYQEMGLNHVTVIDCDYLCRTNEGIREIDRRVLREAYCADEYLLVESR